MANEIALPTVVAELTRRAGLEQSTPRDLHQVIRAMQRLGLPSVDIEVHIERLRAANDATAGSPIVENNCLIALEIAVGDAGDYSLSWDNSEMAAIYVPRVVTRARAEENLLFALEPSDLLPPRRTVGEPPDVVNQIPDHLAFRLEEDLWRPSRADEFRVPKSAFTTRPASLLVFADRLVLETLAASVEAQLDLALPEAVVWPRRRGPRPDTSTFKDIPASWGTPYIVKVDISGFYEAVDHTLLAMILAGRLDAHSNVAQAVEHVLGAIMGRTTGLPQGPLASDVLASAYLVLIDDKLTSEGWTYSRLADDYFIAAESMADGRMKIETIERLLGEHGLRLNETKTSIMRHGTYVDALDAPPPSLARLRDEIRRGTGLDLAPSQDKQEIAGILTDAGADEQLLFDVLYHGTMTIEEAIVELGESLDLDAVTLRLSYLQQIDEQLASGQTPDDMNAIGGVVRDCVAFMAAANSIEALAPIERLLSWFPSVAPFASIYLASAASVEPEAVDAALSRLLKPLTLSDWTAAWLCRSIERRTGRLSNDLATLLDKLILDQRFGPLTTVNSVWALASKGGLSQAQWTAAIGGASSAVAAELLLARASSPQLYLNDQPSTDQAIGFAPAAAMEPRTERS